MSEGERAPKSSRQYRMTARAEATEARGEKILDAAEAVFFEEPVEKATLAAIADEAGVTVQTVIRRFGSREDLFGAVLARTALRVSRHRGEARPGDVEGAARVIVEHYEEVGDGVLRLLAQEERRPALRKLGDAGRAYHRSWCRRVFAPTLRQLSGVERERRLAQLVAVTDVYTWKLLRHQAGLSARQTELAIRELLETLTADPRSAAR
ncbi:MAG TPA: helix-turn-helix domain-containing protein [Solirubrobacterales bacterium]